MTEKVRITLINGTTVDADLTVPWEAFVYQLLANACIITSDAFINRASIAAIVRFDPENPRQDGAATATILDFPAPKGTA